MEKEAMEKGVKAADPALEEEIARLVRQEVGGTDPQMVRAVVREVLASLETRKPPAAEQKAVGPVDIGDCIRCRAKGQPGALPRGVVTVTGHNRPGIVARVSNLVAEYEIDILDISQTIVGGFFTMILVLDLSQLARQQRGFAEVKAKLAALGKSLGVEIVAVHEEIFRGMQRI